MDNKTQARTDLVAQLRTLLLLTNTEIQTATARQAQARTDAVRRELARNAEDATRRARRIAVALRHLGGVPDAVTPVIGRIGALVTTIAAQAEPLAGALLDDLTVEHQLIDRALYAKALATAAGEPTVVELTDSLVAAHGETVEWLTTVLAQAAVGAPTALQATPLQATTTATARALGVPLRWATAGLDRTVNRVRSARGGDNRAG